MLLMILRSRGELALFYYCFSHKLHIQANNSQRNLTEEDYIMKRKLIFILTFLTLVLFIGSIGLLIFVNAADEYTEDNTVEYAATISQVKPASFGDYIEIQTNEHTSLLYISEHISPYLNEKQINNLEQNEAIYFRIDSRKNSQLDNVEFVDIVALRTDSEVVFSLSNYNDYIHTAFQPTRIAGVVIAALLFTLFLGGVCLCFKVTRQKTGD